MRNWLGTFFTSLWQFSQISSFVGFITYSTQTHDRVSLHLGLNDRLLPNKDWTIYFSPPGTEQMVSPDPYLNMRVLHNWDRSIDFSWTKHVAYLQMWMKNLLIPRQIKIMGQYVMHLNEMVVGTVNCIDGNNNNFYIIVQSMNIWVISTCLFYHWTNVLSPFVNEQMIYPQ